MIGMSFFSWIWWPGCSRKIIICLNMKITTLIVSFCFLHGFAICQLPPASVLQAPNVAGLGTFGAIPVNYNTGTPDISIPLYTVTSGNIQVPIVLRYHQASVRPNEHPGWVGLGWSLSPGGVITRETRNYPDEYENKLPTFSSYENGGRQKLAAPDWDSQAKLKTYFTAEGGNFTEMQADKFHFSFLGYSGTFFQSHEGWQVISEKDVKVEVLQYIKNSISNKVRQNLPDFPFLTSPLGVQERFYYEFKLTTEDGTQFIFGGRDSGDEDAIDLKIPYNQYITDYAIDTWHLTSIIQPNNETISFKYHRKYPICNLRFNASTLWFSGSNGCNAFQTENVSTTKHGGVAFFPAYLDEIIWNNGSVKFTTSYSTELPYPDNYLKYSQDGQSYEINPAWLATNTSDGMAVYSNLKWEQLDNIQVINKKGEIIHNFLFEYSNSTNQRLTLNGLREKDRQNSNSNRIYSFQYNNVQSLPAYGGDYTDHWGYYNGRSVNGLTFPQLQTSSDPNRNKLPNPSLASIGLLNKIIYPTGGYTEFDWEPHKYGKVLAGSRQTMDTESGFGGGSRIKEIRSYDKPGATPITKKYYYVLNYNGNDVGLQSSGQLNGRPQYYVSIPLRPLNAGTHSAEYQTGSVVNTTNYGLFTQGSPIGYTEVVEKNSDNSYSKFIYSGFNTDIYGVSHFDKPVESIGWLPGEERYMTMSSVESERGKILQLTHYTASNAPVERKEYRYNDDVNRFNSFIKTLVLDYTLGPCIAYDALILATAPKQFKYRYYLKSETTIKYNPDLTQSSSIKTYNYNPVGLITSLSEFDSDGTALVTTYKYVSDFDNTEYVTGCTTTKNTCVNDIQTQTNQCIALCAGNPSCIAGCNSARDGMLGTCEMNYQNCINIDQNSIRIMEMKNKLLLSSIVEKQQRKIYHDASSKVLGGELTFYKKLNNGLYIPSQVHKMELSTASSELINTDIGSDGRFAHHTAYQPSVFFDYYDDKGNVLQYHEIDNTAKSFLWGYQQSMPIAVVSNAGSASIFFDSFEEEIGWDENLTGYDNTFAHAGRASGKLEKLSAGKASSSSTKLVSINSSGKYKYSGWVYSNGPSVDVNLLMKTQAETGGYTYIDKVSTTAVGKWVYLEREFVVPQTISTLTLRVDNNGGGIVWFDDLRLHPASAQMQTYTFDPIIGITSITDEKNNAMIYEYDLFNRLKLIRDQDGKILKRYVYHYKNQ